MSLVTVTIITMITVMLPGHLIRQYLSGQLRWLSVDPTPADYQSSNSTNMEGAALQLDSTRSTTCTTEYGVPTGTPWTTFCSALPQYQILLTAPNVTVWCLSACVLNATATVVDVTAIYLHQTTVTPTTVYTGTGSGTEIQRKMSVYNTDW